MSDIPDNGSFNLGLANIASQNYGPAATTTQGLQGAQTQNMQAETQGKLIQNKSAQLQFQLFQSAMNHLTDFSGQDGPTHDADDSSGVSADSASPSSTIPNASGVVKPEADIGASVSDQAKIEALLEKEYNINPMGTPQEQRAIVQAQQYATQMKLSGNKGLADAADERVSMLKNQRDMGVGTRKNAAQVDAAGHYDKLSAVSSAPQGKAWDTL